MIILVIWRALVMIFKFVDWSIFFIKLEIGCFLRIIFKRLGGVWYSIFRIAFIYLCRIVGLIEELNILYKVENIL